MIRLLMRLFFACQTVHMQAGIFAEDDLHSLWKGCDGMGHKDDVRMDWIRVGN